MPFLRLLCLSTALCSLASLYAAAKRPLELEPTSPTQQASLKQLSWRRKGALTMQTTRACSRYTPLILEPVTSHSRGAAPSMHEEARSAEQLQSLKVAITDESRPAIGAALARGEWLSAEDIPLLMPSTPIAILLLEAALNKKDAAVAAALAPFANIKK